MEFFLRLIVCSGIFFTSCNVLWAAELSAESHDQYRSLKKNGQAIPDWLFLQINSNSQPDPDEAGRTIGDSPAEATLLNPLNLQFFSSGNTYNNPDNDYFNTFDCYGNACTNIYPNDAHPEGTNEADYLYPAFGNNFGDEYFLSREDWFTFTLDWPATFYMSTCADPYDSDTNNNDFDTSIALLDASQDLLILNDDAFACDIYDYYEYNSSIEVDLNAGTYFALVGGYGTGYGNYDVEFAFTGGVDAPENLEASDGTYTDGVHLSWSAVSGATQYKVYSTDSYSIDYAVPLTGWMSGTSYIDVSLDPGDYRNYWVQAAGTNPSNASSVLSEKNSGTRGLEAPNNISAWEGLGSTSIKVEWDVVDGAYGYSVYRNTSNSIPEDPVTDTTDDNFYLDRGNLVAGQIYFYWVRAYMGDGMYPSQFSASATGYLCEWDCAENLSVFTIADAHTYDWDYTNFGSETELHLGYVFSQLETNLYLGFSPISIPEGAILEHAELLMYATYYEQDFQCYTYRVTEAWDEHTINGMDLPEHGDTIENSTYFSAEAGGYYEFDSMEGVLEYWLQYPEEQFGLNLQVSDWSGNYALFASRENSLDYPPYLSIVYTFPVEPVSGIIASDGNSSSQVSVSWDAASGAGYYQVMRSIVNDGSQAESVSTWIAGTTFNDLSATPGIDYYYWVRAKHSSTDTYLTPLINSDAGWRVIPTPANMQATDYASESVIEVSWNSSAGAGYYQLFRSLTSELSDAEVLNDWDTPTSYTDAAVSPGIIYFYWVRAAVDMSGYHPSSLSDYNSGILDNSPPELDLPASISMDEDSNANLFLPDYITDPEGVEMIFSAESSAHIIASIVNDRLYFNPQENWSGSESITVIADDQFERETASTSILVIVSPVNDPPEINLPTQIGFTEDFSYNLDMEAFVSDVDNTELYISVIDGIHIHATVSGLDVIFYSDQNFNGSESLQLTVSDGVTRLTDTDNILVVVHPADDCPSQINEMEDVLTPEDHSYTFTSITEYFTDVDGDELNVSSGIVEPLDFGIVEAVGENYVFTPSPDVNGACQISFSVTDGDCEISGDTFTMTVTPQNDAPTISLPAQIAFTEDFVYNLDIEPFIDDIDADELSISAENGEYIFTVVDDLFINFSAAQNYHGSETITVWVSDSVSRAVASDSMLIVVHQADDCPVQVQQISDVVIDEDTEYTFSAITEYFDDPDEDELSISDFAVNPSEAGALIAGGGDYIFNPGTHYHGICEIVFTITDGECEIESNTIQLTIEPVQDVPIVILPLTEIMIIEDNSDSSIDLNAVFADDDGDVLTFSYDDSGCPHLDIQILDGIVTISPEADWNGSETAIFIADDGIELRDTVDEDLLVIVSPENDCPVLETPFAAIEINEDETFTIVDPVSHFADADLDDELSLISWELVPEENASLMLVGDDLFFEPAANVSGSYTIEAIVGDGICTASSTLILVTIQQVNDPPVIGLPDSFSFDEDTELVEDLSAWISDVENDNLILTVSANTFIIVSIEDLSVSFSASENWYGSEILTFTVDDQVTRLIASDEIEIVVTAVNDAPQVILELTELILPEDGSDSSIDLNDVFFDVDNDPLSFSYNESEIENLDVLIVNGLVGITPNEQWNGSELLVFTADDGQQAVSSKHQSPVDGGKLLKSDIYKEETQAIALNRDTAEEDLLITVTPEPDCPYFCGEEISLPDGLEDMGLEIPGIELEDLISENFCDADNDLVSFVNLTADIEGFGFTELPELFIITLPVNFYGPTVLTLTVTDGNCEVSRNFDWYVQPLNDPPVVNFCNADDLPCGIVEDLDSFNSILLNQGVEISIVDVDSDTFDLKWYVDDILVYEQEASVTECAFYIPDITNLLDHDLQLHFELDDAGLMYNSEGIDCLWSLAYTSVDEFADVPVDFYLGPNYPNPFNPRTTINFGLPYVTEVQISIYNVIGQRIDVLQNGDMQPGHHQVLWDASTQTSGVYFAVFESQSFNQILKLILIK
jgi:hypothetical protein